MYGEEIEKGKYVSENNTFYAPQHYHSVQNKISTKEEL